MWYWNTNKLNEIIDNKKGRDLGDVSDKVTYAINSKGLEKNKRFEYQKNIIDKLNKK